MNPQRQTQLIGYKETFNHFIKINNNKKLPNNILLSGKKGIGKSTFAYHLFNYLFSMDENYKYDVNKNLINNNNESYKLVINNSHPNFYSINLKNEKKSIEINQVREMINFVNKSSFNNKKKYILINDAEFLNLNSVNALLKIIEEPSEKNYFILINNIQHNMIKTLKSRFIEFKLQLNDEFFDEVIKIHFDKNVYKNLSIDFKNCFLSPYIIINLINFCEEKGLDYENITIDEFLKYIISNSSYKNNLFIKNNIKLFIELFFKKKITISKNNRLFDLYTYFNKKFYLFNKFNLDLESLIIEFNSKLSNE